MTWFRHGAAIDTIARASVVDSASECCSIRLPLQSQDTEDVCAWLHLDYAADDPLAVSASIRSPSGRAVVERMILRADLRRATFEPVLMPGVTVGPAGAHGCIAIVFHEESIAVPVTMPGSALAEFLRACDALVRMTERAEADALTRSFARAMQSWV